MIINFFKSIRPGVFILLGIAFIAVAVFYAPEPIFTKAYFIPGRLLYFLFESAPWLGRILSISLLIALAFRINFFSVRAGLFKTSNALPALFFLLWTIYFPDGFNNPVIVLATLFASLGIFMLGYSFSQNRDGFYTFNAGVLFAIAALLYWPFVLMILLPWVSFIFNGISRWRIWLIALLGPAAIAMIFTGVFVWLPSESDFGYLNQAMNWVENGVSHLWRSPTLALRNLTIIALVLFSLFELQRNLPRKKVHNRRAFSLVVFAALVAGMIWILSPSHSNEASLLLGVPMSLILANAFYYLRAKWYWDVIIIALFAISAINI